VNYVGTGNEKAQFGFKWEYGAIVYIEESVSSLWEILLGEHVGVEGNG
jgi:hypothetical protein